MTTMDLLGKLLQRVVGLGAFGVVMALLLAFLDRPEDKPRPESWRAAIALGLRPRLIIIGVLVLLALLARLLYGAVPWMTQGLTNALIILAVAGVAVVVLQWVLDRMLQPASPAVRSAVLRAIGAAIVAAIVIVAQFAESIEALEWVTPALVLAGVIVGWPVVGVLLATAALAFAPHRIRRQLRLVAWLVGAVAVVVIALVLEQGREQPIGVWPWTGALAISVIGVLGYLADRDDDSRPMLVFLVPAAMLLTIGLIYPAIRTTMLAFTGRAGEFVGMENFVWMFTQRDALITLGNTIAWVILVPLLSTAASPTRSSSTRAAASACTRCSCSCPWRSRSSGRASSGTSCTPTAAPRRSRSASSTSCSCSSAASRSRSCRTARGTRSRSSSS